VSLRGIGGRGQHRNAPAASLCFLAGRQPSHRLRAWGRSRLGGGSPVLDLVPVALRAVASVGRDELLMIDVRDARRGLCGG
jgi:hypothetical protein